MPASVAAHVALVLAASMAMKHRHPVPMPVSNFEVVFAASSSSTRNLPSLELARPPGQEIFDDLSQHVPSLEVASSAVPIRSYGVRVPVPHHPRAAPMTQGIVPVPSTATTAPAVGSRDEVPRDLLAPLQARIRQAVQAAVIYPDSARMMRREGRAQVGFTFADGAVSHVAVTVSSGSHLLDAASLAAVRSAAMPRPPAEMAGRTLLLQVWVGFSLAFE